MRIHHMLPLFYKINVERKKKIKNHRLLMEALFINILKLFKYLHTISRKQYNFVAAPIFNCLRQSL